MTLGSGTWQRTGTSRLVRVMHLARFGRLPVCPWHLQQDLVSIVVLRLPAPLTDGTTRVGQQGHQFTHVLHSELQQRRISGDGTLVTGQPLQGELNVHVQVGEDGEDAEVGFPLAGAPAKNQLIEAQAVGVAIVAAVDGEAYDFLAVVHRPDGPEWGPWRQGEEVLAARQVGQEPAVHTLCVVVAPGWSLQRAVQL